MAKMANPSASVNKVKEPPGIAEKTLTALFTGGVSSAVGKTCVAPFERVRLILQTQSLIKGHDKQYKGSIDALRRVAKDQGFFSLWRGNVANIARIIPTYALRFTFLDIFQVALKKSEKDLSLPEQMTCGGLSGTLTILMTYPLDLARTRMSAEVTAKGTTRPRQPPGLIKVLNTVAREEGFFGLYRGLFISIVEISPYLAISLGGFEYFKRRIPEEHNTPLVKLLVAWSVGVVASLVCFPIDTVKRRVMLDGTVGFKHSEVAEKAEATMVKQKKPPIRAAGSTLKYVREMYNTGGIQLFYRGCFLNALKSAPGAALTFVANDHLKLMVAQHRA